jgi:phytoene dehydrogenase-like protein
MRSEHDVVVIGAGLAGLAAGATAAATGARVLVLDGRTPGGRARTTERDGYLLNEGPHALYRGGPAERVLRSLGVRPHGSPPPLGGYRLALGGGDHLLPTTARTLVRTGALGLRSKVQFGRLLAVLPRLVAADLAGTSAAGWIADQDLRPDAAATLRALTRVATYCGDLDRLSADAAVGQLQAASGRGVLYLDGGWAQLVAGLARQVELRPGSPARGLDTGAGTIAVETAADRVTARAVVVAAGAPPAASALLPSEPGWDVGPPVTAACLDAGTRRVPSPGYVLSADEPLYATTQSPPARQAPPGHALVAAIRYGARSAAEDRPDLEAFIRRTGITEGDVVTRRFLARMVVAGGRPLPGSGLGGRPGPADTGVAGVFVAGDWVGPEGLLADAALASGQAAGLAAARWAEGSATMAA